MICPACNHEQETGKFCGKCGTAVIETAQQEISATAEAVTPTPAQTVSGNENLEKAKNISRQYGKHALGLLKNPGQAFNLGEQHFINGITTIVLYALAFALTLYFFINKLFKTVFGEVNALFDEGPAQSLPFFELASRFFITGIIFIAIGLVTTLVLTKVIGETDSIKTFIAKFSGILIPFTAVNVVTMLLALMGFYKATIVLALVSALFVAIIVPGFYMYKTALNKNHKVDSLYWGIGTQLITMFITYLFIKSSVIETINRFREQVPFPFLDMM